MKKLITIIFFSLTLFSCSNENNVITPQKYFQTGSVFTGSVDNFSTYVGYLEGENTTNLSTKLGGEVVGIYAKEGDYVKAGDLLLSLDSMEAKVGYSTSSSIVSGLEDLKNSTASMFDEQIKAMEEKKNQANIGKTGIFTGLEDVKNIASSNLNTALTGLETAKLNLENTKIIFDTKEKNIYDNSRNAIVSSVILDTNIINFIDNILGVTEANKNKNNDYEIYLSAKKSGFYNDSKIQFSKTNELYKKYKKMYDENIEDKNPSNEVLLETLDLGEQIAESIKVLLSITYDVLDNTVENTYLSKETLDGYKNTIATFGTNIESSLITVSGEYFLGLKGSKQSLSNFYDQKKLQLELLEKQVELAQKTYDQYKVSNDAKINETQTKTEIANSQINEVAIGIESLKKQKQAQIDEINLKIKEALGQQNNSSVMINSGEIRSPISGVIVSKNVELGQVIGGGMPVFTISDEKNLKLNILVGDEVLQNLVLGQDILLDVDGYDKQVKAKISMIYPSKDFITKKTKVEISFKNNYNLKIGTYTKVFLSNIGDFDSILVPNSAIVSKYMIPGVYVLNQDNTLIFKKVDIVKSNDRFSEIIGLKSGDIVITEGKDNFYDGEKVE
ncbi:MAG: efflux RND transporter periplasmic adaptor subunit [Candidatus Gracilibacteria bacterium]|nr:efflux RND transporter periplasmic adaptor subunit [Candidatus Gracilibacteria bacterium]